MAEPRGRRSREFHCACGKFYCAGGACGASSSITMLLDAAESLESAVDERRVSYKSLSDVSLDDAIESRASLLSTETTTRAPSDLSSGSDGKSASSRLSSE
eukprot:4439595-Prymnesium_polylepis.1